MASEYKYLGVGLAGGIIVAAVLIAGMLFASAGLAAMPTPTPEIKMRWTAPSVSPPTTSTPSATDLPTVTPYPTLLLSPTATLTHTEYMRANGQLLLAGALPDLQQIQLYESSLKYIAQSPPESLVMAQRINGVEYGNPANTCGPLSLAILRDAGLVKADMSPHAFWLLNPWVKEDRDFLNATLPAPEFEHFAFHAWMKGFDWRAFPLLPGDFLYIHAGGGGNFDHMLVVTRLDEHLRAYAVTNYQRPDGFVIDEVLLYDPGDSSAGIFDTWTERQNAVLGSTGFGGFEVWRPAAP
jgi:hypothetical protein